MGERGDGGRVSEEGEEEVFGADIFVVKVAGFFGGADEDLAGFVGELGGHGISLG